MIFRKPYAMLIKYFKVIHIILTICMAYLIYRTYTLNAFISEYMKTTMLALGKGATTSLFNMYMFILPIVLIIFSIVMLITMIKKDKPKTLYLLNIIVFSVILILYFFIQHQLYMLEENILAAKDIRLIYDFTIIMTFMQSILIIPTLIRAIGFDIKKFDFKKDLLDMDIKAEDNEEFEVSFNLEGNLIKRWFNKELRTIKYAYLENKFLFKVLGLFLIILIAFWIINRPGNLNTEIGMNESFSSDNISLEITNAYITSNNYKLKNITPARYVILEINSRSVKPNTKLNTARMQLMIDKQKFYPKEDVLADDVSDLGTLYIKNNLETKNYKKYLVVYEITSNLVKEKMSFRYISQLDTAISEYVTVSIDAKDIDKKPTQETMQLNKEVTLNEDIFNSSTFMIKSVDLAEEFTVPYKYCVSKSECYSSKEYIRPNLNSTIEKGLLRIEADYIKDTKTQIPGIINAFNLINKFGTIVYKYNGTTYKLSGNLVNITPNKFKQSNVFYIEVNKKMLNSDYVYLLLKIRNKEYKYIIKSSQQ